MPLYQRTIVKAGADRTIANTTWTTLTLGNMTEDDVGAWDAGSPTVLTCPPGKDRVKITVFTRWESFAASGSQSIRQKVQINGADIGEFDYRYRVFSTGNSWATRWRTIAAGQTIRLQVWHDRGANTLVRADSFIMVEWASSADLVLTTLRRTDVQTISSGAATDIIWNQEVRDDPNAWASGTPTIITVPAGKTRMRVTGYQVWHSITSGLRQMILYKVGDDHVNSDMRQAVTQACGHFNTCWWPVTPGDQYRVMVWQGLGSNWNFSHLEAGDQPEGCAYVEFEWA